MANTASGGAIDVSQYWPASMAEYLFVRQFALLCVPFFAPRLCGEGTRGRRCKLSPNLIPEFRMSAMPPFHLASPVTSLAKAREFPGELLGCPEGRSSNEAGWTSISMATRSWPTSAPRVQAPRDQRGGRPQRSRAATSARCCQCRNGRSWPAKLKAAGTSFIIEPHIRFKGEPGEQATMFFLDPSRQRHRVQGLREPAEPVCEIGARPASAGRDRARPGSTNPASQSGQTG